MGTVALAWDFYYYFGFSLSVSFHQYPTDIPLPLTHGTEYYQLTASMNRAFTSNKTMYV